MSRKWHLIWGKQGEYNCWEIEREHHIFRSSLCAANQGSEVLELSHAVNLKKKHHRLLSFL